MTTLSGLVNKSETSLRSRIHPAFLKLKMLHPYIHSQHNLELQYDNH